MVTTSQTTAGEFQENSKELTGEGGLCTSPILEVGGNAKEFGGDKMSQVGSLGYIISNPEKPYKEYIIIAPDKYNQELSYYDYLKIYKPIVVGESQTI